jgi:uncharacterized RDD family membrane protein YckC
MSAIDDYITSVLRNMPAAMPDRSAIATELRGHIAERVAHGQPVADVLRQLGDPVKLAESYLSAVPLRNAPLGHRALAKIIDGAASFAVMGAVGWSLTRAFGLELRDGFGFPVLILVLLVGGSFAFAAYTIFAEQASGQTVGKRLLGIRVVRESGTRISLGQSIVRQLPMFLQVFWIDAMFALFTERSQRAFEMLSKTRTVVASPDAPA